MNSELKNVFLLACLLFVVHPCTLCGHRLRIIRVIHSSDFAVLRDNYRGIGCNFSTFLGLAF